MKISYIMQSYLGEYPGSRSDSDKKFLRAVQSFIDQEDKNSELIIVSDGCEITHNLYYKHFKDNDRIKYVYVDKDTPNMYEGDIKYYRGFPRQVGRSLVTGEITTYMDSDDFLMPDSVNILKKNWKIAITLPEKKYWSMTTSWIDNISSKEMHSKNNTLEIIGDDFKIKGLDGDWLKIKIKQGYLMSATFSISHISTATSMWTDHIGVDKKSEDQIFANKLYDEGEGFIIIEPYYVRCHYSNQWDY